MSSGSFSTLSLISPKVSLKLCCTVLASVYSVLNIDNINISINKKSLIKLCLMPVLIRQFGIAKY